MALNLKERYRVIQILNATRVKDYEAEVFNTAATKIQARWRGYWCRRNIVRVKAPAEKANKVDIPDAIGAERARRIYSTILQKFSFNPRDSNEELKSKVAQLKALQSKSALYTRSERLTTNYVSRIEAWMDAYGSGQSLEKTKDDPTADEAILKMHKNCLLQASKGWYKAPPEDLANDEFLEILLPELSANLSVQDRFY